MVFLFVVGFGLFIKLSLNIIKKTSYSSMKSHHFAALEAKRLYEITQKKKKLGDFYSNIAGGQNDTYKLPEPEPVPSSPAAANLASLRTRVM